MNEILVHEVVTLAEAAFDFESCASKEAVVIRHKLKLLCWASLGSAQLLKQ